MIGTFSEPPMARLYPKCFQAYMCAKCPTQLLMIHQLNASAQISDECARNMLQRADGALVSKNTFEQGCEWENASLSALILLRGMHTRIYN